MDTNNRSNIYIIGSGPAGVAAAQALLRQGVAVTMLDVGLTIEPERAGLVEAMYADVNGADAWTEEQIRELKGELIASATGIPLKRLYGSDFPHRDLGQGDLTATGTGDVLTSGAQGGFSNVWGAQLMPYMARDREGWPVAPGEMEAHYRAVLDFVPLSARPDDLAEHLPIYQDDPICLRPSRQGQAILDHMDAHRDALRAQGIVHGASRVAVQVERTTENPRGCVYCGLCMHGCPFRLIYNSAQTLEILRRDPLFTYLPDVLVERLEDRPDGVTIVARQLPDKTPVTFDAERVYLGAGAVSTARILLDSLGAYDRELIIHDSVQVLMPLLLKHAVSGVTREPLHTLGQANALIFDDAISPRAMHLQFYTYNDHFDATMRGMLRGLYTAAAPLLPLLMYSRLGVAFGYLHSDDSPAMAARLTRTPEGGTAFTVNAHPSPRTQSVAKALIQKVWKTRGLTGVTPILPQVKVMPPGKGYHFGASFPMQAETPAPGAFASDRWGRPAGMDRVHVVDGSVLPNLASTTFTFTVMANAHRIASSHHSFDQLPLSPGVSAANAGRGVASLRAGVRASALQENQMKKIGITGARGYMGSRVAAHFRKAGWTVVEMSRAALGKADSKPGDVDAIPFTLADPPTADALAARGLDALIHCAWDLEARTHEEIWRVNVEGSKRLLDAAKEAGIGAVVFISTVSAYPGTTQMYGLAKLEVEAEAKAVGAYIVRPGLTYGVGAGGMVGKLASALKLPVVPLIGTGRERQPLTHEEDLCRLLQTLCEDKPPVQGRPITAASQNVPTFREILTEIARADGKTPRFLPIPYQAVYGLLRGMEKAGMKPNFRSDSVLGLVKPNPSLDFSTTNEIGASFRPFQAESLRG